MNEVKGAMDEFLIRVFGLALALGVALEAQAQGSKVHEPKDKAHAAAAPAPGKLAEAARLVVKAGKPGAMVLVDGIIAGESDKPIEVWDRKVFVQVVDGDEMSEKTVVELQAGARKTVSVKLSLKVDSVERAAPKERYEVPEHTKAPSNLDAIMADAPIFEEIVD